MQRVLVTDSDRADDMIQERKRLGLDRYDEVWDGVYVMPSMPTNVHQKIVDDLGDILSEVVKRSGLGEKYPGANVSDRRRIPDIVVVLKNSHAVDCGTHFMGGPDFLVEIQSPGDDTEDKIPFYGEIGVRELLILHRDRRTLRLLRNDGTELIEVKPEEFEGKQWVLSEVLPLAFRRTTSKGVPRNEVHRTDGQPGSWTI
jgi:Uma2 family endonuclease